MSDVVTSERAEDLRGIMSVNGERHGQCGPRVYTSIEHRSLWPTTFLGWRWYSCAGMYVVSPKSKNLPVISGPLHGLFQTVPHGFVGDDPQRLAPENTTALHRELKASITVAS